MIDRRCLLSGIASLPALGAFASVGATADEQLYGCVIGHQRPTGTTKTVLDFWTARISEFDMRTLPDHVGRAVVWDDMFRSQSLRDDFQTVVDQYLPDWHGVLRKTDCHFAFYLNDLNTITNAVDNLALPSFGERSSIALLDLTSVGIGWLNWAHIIPLLHQHYHLVVGIDYAEGDGQRPSPDAETYAALCDFALLFTDQTLGFNHATLYDERRPHADAVLHRLIASLEHRPIEDVLATHTRTGLDPWLRIAPLTEVRS